MSKVGSGPGNEQVFVRKSPLNIYLTNIDVRKTVEKAKTYDRTREEWRETNKTTCYNNFASLENIANCRVLEIIAVGFTERIFGTDYVNFTQDAVGVFVLHNITSPVEVGNGGVSRVILAIDPRRCFTTAIVSETSRDGQGQPYFPPPRPNTTWKCEYVLPQSIWHEISPHHDLHTDWAISFLDYSQTFDYNWCFNRYDGGPQWYIKARVHFY